MQDILYIETKQEILELHYTLVFSNRKSLGIEIKPGGEIIVRAPKRATKKWIAQCLEEKKMWIYKNHLKMLNRTVQKEETDSLHFQALKKRYVEAAREYIPKRVAYYHQFTGGKYSQITIRDQKTRWGSCSSKGTLSFNYKLMLAPPKVLDYVVVHELCHLTHMNHSKEFWQAVESVMPDYKIHRKWLKENGNNLSVILPMSKPEW